MKKINLITLFICILSACLIFTSCTKKTYKITVSVGEENYSYEVLVGESFEKPDDPKLFGYEFIGWYVEDTEYDFNNKVKNDITIVAKFKKLDYAPKWELNKNNYNGNGETIKIYYENKYSIDFVNPFSEYYKYSDKETRQKHISEIEKAYNIKIEYETYSSVFSDNVINDIQSSNVPTVLNISSDYLSYYESLLNFYKFNDSVYENNSNIQILTNGYGYTNTSNNFFMYYNKTLLEKLELEDPASLWLEGKWTYNDFELYIENLNNKLNKLDTKMEYKVFNNCYEPLF